MSATAKAKKLSIDTHSEGKSTREPSSSVRGNQPELSEPAGYERRTTYRLRR
jgi:hypothetical protein